MARIRTLIVDDSGVIRRILTKILSSDPAIDVVGAAADGRLALEMIESLAPDIVTLDIEMPVMDGLETMAEIQKRRPRLPVVMVSTLTERGATATLRALAFGALDYVTKPEPALGPEAAEREFREQLIPKVKNLCRRVLEDGAASKTARPSLDVPERTPRTPQPIVARAPSARAPSSTFQAPKADASLAVPARVDLVVLATSTGGPQALETFFKSLPKDFPVPIAIVQHMPPKFTKVLAEHLDRLGGVRVAEGADGAAMTPGSAWIAPGDHHMVVQEKLGRLSLAIHRDAPVQSCRPSADVLFRSAASGFGKRALGVVLTGMGEDGLAGCRELKTLGSTIVVQDQGSSVIWGMPGAVARAGLADVVVPLEEIASTVLRLVNVSRGRIPVRT